MNAQSNTYIHVMEIYIASTTFNIINHNQEYSHLNPGKTKMQLMQIFTKYRNMRQILSYVRCVKNFRVDLLLLKTNKNVLLYALK